MEVNYRIFKLDTDIEVKHKILKLSAEYWS